MDMTIFGLTAFGDQSAIKDFLFANAQAHRDVAHKLALMGKKIDSKPLTDMSEDNDDWLLNHNDIHQQELAALGISNSPSLGEVDLQDESQYNDWMREHALLHMYINQALGL